MNGQRGFTLIEMLIVVALILIIAAITIPSMLEAKINANESSAVGSIRAINSAEVSYSASFGGYANELANLGGAEPCTKSAETACLLDDSLASGSKSGYRFVATGGDASGGSNTSYLAAAAPEVFNRTGKRLFCSSDRGVIRADLNANGSTSPPDVQQCAHFAALK